MSGRPRSLADDLRARDDEALAKLLQARPDLATPVPAEVGQLAARATTRISVTRTIDRLDAFHLQVLDALATLDEPSTYEQVHDLFGGSDEDLGTALDRLRDLALLWESDDGLHLARTAREILGPHPAGIGPPASQALLGLRPQRLAGIATELGLMTSGDPAKDAQAISELLRDPDRLQELLDDVGETAVEALNTLAAGPPSGALPKATRDVAIATAKTPVDSLLARGLLVPVDHATVLLPREVALHLRGGHLHRELAIRPPDLDITERESEMIDRTAGSSAAEVLRRMEGLLEAWAEDPPPVLRSGGLGVRDLRRVATTLGVEGWYAGWLADLAYAAGLVAHSSDVDEVWLPTPAFDSWRADDTARRWALLATTWLHTSRTPGLVGSRDERERMVSAMGHDLDRPVAAEIRRLVLEVLAGTAPGAAPTPDSVLASVQWHRPRRGGRLRDQVVGWTLREAEALGVTGFGALSSPGRALLRDETVAEAVAQVLPAFIDHVLIQADLTAIAPGPLLPELAVEMGLLADVESQGGATVYRFTAGSVRRALDAGRTVAEIGDFLKKLSKTPVPQPLTYLVEDVARRHGLLRVGAARSVVRCEDEALLTEILSDRRAEDLGLRRLAPTVLSAEVPPAAVLDLLRQLGHAPAPEAADGSLLVPRPEERRAPNRGAPKPLLADRPVPDWDLAMAAVRALRAGEQAGERRPVAGTGGPIGQLGRGNVGALVRTLSAAARSGASVWIGYLDNHGSTSERLIDPVRIEGGWLTAVDHRSGEIRTFALHRISGVAVLEDETY